MNLPVLSEPAFERIVLDRWKGQLGDSAPSGHALLKVGNPKRVVPVNVPERGCDYSGPKLALENWSAASTQAILCADLPKLIEFTHRNKTRDLTDGVV